MTKLLSDDGHIREVGMSYGDKVAAVIIAAWQYSAWARDAGDHPHDEAGRRAHEALLKAVRDLGGARHRHVDDPGLAHPDNSDSPAWASPAGSPM